MRATRMRPTLPVKACDSYPPQTACLPGVHHRKSWEEAGPSLGCRTSSETSVPTRGSPPFPFPGPWPSQRRQSKLEEQGLASERSKRQETHQLEGIGAFSNGVRGSEKTALIWRCEWPKQQSHGHIVTSSKAELQPLQIGPEGPSCPEQGCDGILCAQKLVRAVG